MTDIPETPIALPTPVLVAIEILRPSDAVSVTPLPLLLAVTPVKPDLVLNFGSAGRVSSLETGIFEIGSVIERDFLAMPLSERGVVPFDEFPHEISSYHSGIKCATGDSFVTKKDSWLIERKVDVVDMELFAIAKVSKKLGVPWRSFKYITDDTNESSGKDWKENLVKADGAFQLVLEKILSKTIY